MTNREKKKQSREFLRRTYRSGVLGVVNRAAMQYKQFEELSKAAGVDKSLLATLAERHGPIA